MLDISFGKNQWRNSLFFYPTNETEIKTTIYPTTSHITQSHTLDNPTYDKISPVLVNNVADNIIVHLEYLINKSMSTGETPGDFKYASEIPLFKKSDRLSPDNYI